MTCVWRSHRRMHTCKQIHTNTNTYELAFVHKFTQTQNSLVYTISNYLSVLHVKMYKQIHEQHAHSHTVPTDTQTQTNTYTVTTSMSQTDTQTQTHTYTNLLG